ncbi:uncharacterized protein LOC111411965 isoform X2 [Olea europaea var. sylvestris]|uniref:uncharacterized protein LOC111411965 isoform X2 n=1 Tax=Olea europaea var. sylvestris TaxID=158386 RepID=UPI000C1CCF99|nr:uncharacterized protein LOC111411965 isoform X2 [Olea europaea var. sylvestris]XP_022898440.1 uncharacterized protein LOC111411965 isoform X2 [Olea europaea var. sylvestris]XP_022898441.1 uncharacterized protein LOC111411965 isoform X2 [Olea europaea var. sylvestris]
MHLQINAQICRLTQSYSPTSSASLIFSPNCRCQSLILHGQGRHFVDSILVCSLLSITATNQRSSGGFEDGFWSDSSGDDSGNGYCS